jgi:hypothetical protein
LRQIRQHSRDQQADHKTENSEQNPADVAFYTPSSGNAEKVGPRTANAIQLAPTRVSIFASTADLFDAAAE